MRTQLRRVLALAALGVAAGLATATTSLAGWGGNPRPIDSGHQLSSLQTRMAKLTARGQTAKTGALSVLADCGYGASSQIFQSWGDGADYSLAPGGGLASGDGWTLRNASVQSAHDPYSAAAGSIELSGGDPTAESPVTCVNLQYPTFRFFVSHAGPSSASTLEAYVVYEGLDGNAHTLTLARLTAGQDWQPSPIVPIGVNALSAVSAWGWTPISFGFRAVGLLPGESYSVDGLYVDPWRWD